MDLIKELYENKRTEKPTSRAIQEMEASIYQMVRDIQPADEDKREELTDLFFEASLHGELAGFTDGFRYAFRLIAQCLI